MSRRSTLGDLANLLHEGSRLIKSVKELSQEQEVREILSFLRSVRKPRYDPFAELGVDPDSPDELIEKVYRLKASFFHPDRSTGDEEKMRRLNKAYEEVMKIRGKK